ncbi:YecA family protein [Jiulongibacter sediminis]|uniref:SEC-C motif-containing protein n=1 Tax=Jiulongibacter sediminis TaxID=1605367 RepID=A0A0P7BW78_9BACT|nr:SEC-C domain-containing protein [Jiulongibacter sediminis]KPM49224.1 hypothetical protein AFM12_00910 [Jiulongibacter sediminis]TBX26279.1 hypothetical protein TK44_00910 [Jiulongibacter sediminis]
MKTKRNDPCPCGSGKKFKKCCIDKVTQEKSPSNHFDNYDPVSVLTGMAAITLVPQNQDKIVRVEGAMNDALKDRKRGSKQIFATEISKILKGHYPLNSKEDPAENCFIDLITFYGGDYLIFPGITEYGSFVLQQVLQVIFLGQDFDDFPEFKDFVSKVTQFILECSNEIARQNGIARYEFIQSDSTELIVPDNDSLNKTRDYLKLSNLNLPSFSNTSPIIPEILDRFSFSLDEKNQENIFVDRPFIEIEGEYYLISPTNLSYSLTNYIWKYADEFGLNHRLLKLYNLHCWRDVQKALRKMGFLKGDARGVNIGDDQLASFFQFDSDKFAYIYLETEGNNKVEHIAKFRGKLSTKDNTEQLKIFEIAIIPVYGQDKFNLIEKSEADIQLSIPLPELLILNSLKLADALDLWKFASLKMSMLLNGFMFNSVSFLDEYKTYVDNDHSFYSGDYPINGLIIAPGTAVDWRINYRQLKDEHSEYYNLDGKIVIVNVRRKNRSEKVYFALGFKYLLLVPNFNQPVWVQAEDKTYPKEVSSIAHGLTDTIAFWLTELAPFLSEKLALIEDRPLNFFFKVEDWKLFIGDIEKISRDELAAKDFKPSVTEDSVTLTIPFQFVHYAYGPDNLGEAKLVEVLLVSIIKLMSINGNDVKLDITSIVRKVAPPGQKKIFTTSFGSENLLRDPTNVTGLRLLQSFDINNILDKLTDLLGENCPPIGEIENKNEKLSLLNNVVQTALLPLLRERIKVFDYSVLLRKLIRFNEAVLLRRNQIAFEIPTKLACGFMDSESEKELEELLGNIDKTAIALRCLIEHLAAEPHSGYRNPSMTDIDELIAIMNQITEWSSLLDQVHFDFYKENIGILPSKRIGTSKEFQKLTLQYRKIKSQERVNDALDNFQHSFPMFQNTKSNPLPNGLDLAFEYDYNISFTKLCLIIDGFVEIGLAQNSGYCEFDKTDLYENLKKHDSAISENEINFALEYLSLTQRGTVDRLPKDHKFYDIMPWRFNRRLSLLRKPLIQVENPVNSDVTFFWGTKQLLTSRLYYQEQFETNRFRTITNGKMSKYLGKLVKQRDKRLLKNITSILNQKQHLIIDTEVPIDEHSPLYSKITKGDIDVLVIDNQNKVILSLECKSIAESRNIMEMVGEYNKFYDGDHYIEKHLKRDTWIKENLKTIGDNYKVDLEGYSVQSIMITSEQMFTPILKGNQIEIPFCTLLDIKNRGYSVLLEIANKVIH